MSFRKLFVLIMLGFITFNCYAIKCLPIQNSDYMVEWDCDEEFFTEDSDYNGSYSFKIGTSYILYYKYMQKTSEHQIVSICKGSEAISFDFDSVIDDENWFMNNSLGYILFYISENNVDIILINDYVNIKRFITIIRYDFEKMKSYVIFKSSMGFLLSNLQRCSSNNGFGIYDFFVKNNHSFTNEFYLSQDDLTNYITKGLYFSVSNDVLTMDACNDRSSYKNDYLKLVNTFPALLTNKQVVGRSSECLISNYKITAKSCLKEGTVEYSASNMENFSNVPWVPSIPYTEEEITISSESNINGLYICNGFYREGRSDLYTKNNRVKEIEIIYPESYGFKHKVVLIDTAQPQYIPLLNVDCKEIKIKIKSVYPGSLYNDTCINCIIPITEQPEYKLMNWGK